MKDRHKGPAGFPFLITLVILGTVCVCAAVSVWALARPGDDPIGDELARLGVWAGDTVETLRTKADGGIPDWTDAAMHIEGGDPIAGAQLIAQYGCGACHAIPGIARARGSVGPDLSGFRRQSYIAGVLPNRPGDLVNWLQSPPQYSAQTVMPDMGVTQEEAGHMAAYLYTLDRR